MCPQRNAQYAEEQEKEGCASLRQMGQVARGAVPLIKRAMKTRRPITLPIYGRAAEVATANRLRPVDTRTQK